MLEAETASNLQLENDLDHLQHDQNQLASKFEKQAADFSKLKEANNVLQRQSAGKLSLGLRRFRYLSSSLRSSSLHVRHRITEFATYHNPVRYLYLVKKLKACVGEVMVPFTRHNLV